MSSPFQQRSVLPSLNAPQGGAQEDVHLSSAKKKRAGITSPLISPEKDALQPISQLEAVPGANALPEAKRQRRQRVLVDMHNQQESEEEGDDIVENAYERERLERIKRNAEVMRQMGLQQLAAETAAAARGVTNVPDTSNRSIPAAKPRRPPSAKKTGQTAPRRQSGRNRSQDPTAGPSSDHATNNEINAAPEDIGLLEEDHLMELEEYFKVSGIDASAAIRVDGHYSGWVPEHIAETYGLPLEHPGDEWIRSAGAGGSGKRGGGGKKRGSKGGSDAKAISAASLSHNPNAYFYRHVAPNQHQAQGEWSQQEQDKFMEVVRKWGVGDNWGLFASHIAQRVGYQCSAFYRDVIIPSGMVIDPRFKMQRNGKAVFVR